ncbi:hypothetical protein B9Z19DRAFT_1137380 [Tuber borchii]|uniref:Uncharacterized protein n=1 Tax=Tuber borchii TaxID=42251 RepID=A0A2T6ZAJ5_TUBBO|nr:hypothetical protein B9Z19DRAFT_1137380 [Tuber borchii]
MRCRQSAKSFDFSQSAFARALRGLDAESVTFDDSLDLTLEQEQESAANPDLASRLSLNLDDFQEDQAAAGRTFAKTATSREPACKMLSNLEGVWKIDASKEHRAASGRDSKSKLHHDAIGREGDRQEMRGEEQRPSGCERLESEAVRKRERKIRRRRDAGAEHCTSSGRRGRRDRRRDGVRMHCDGMATSGRNVARTLRLESRLTF